jgi:hypothetical protein
MNCAGCSRTPCTNVRTPASASGILNPRSQTDERRTIMGKYFLAWILGVPAIVLVILYLFFH